MWQRTCSEIKKKIYISFTFINEYFTCLFWLESVIWWLLACSARYSNHSNRKKYFKCEVGEMLNRIASHFKSEMAHAPNFSAKRDVDLRVKCILDESHAIHRTCLIVNGKYDYTTQTIVCLQTNKQTTNYHYTQSVHLNSRNSHPK